MESIALDSNFKLSFEKLPHTIRLIVSNNNKELVCRKEILIKLFSFTEIDKANLFMGRLQLFKSDDKIDIQVKKEFIGTISNVIFKRVLNKLK